jgi:hypothetical protein
LAATGRGENPNLKTDVFHEGKSAASFCCQVAAWLPDMFCNIYLIKNINISKNQQLLKLEKK